jgi:hypothetical protein
MEQIFKGSLNITFVDLTKAISVSLGEINKQQVLYDCTYNNSDIVRLILNDIVPEISKTIPKVQGQFMGYIDLTPHPLFEKVLKDLTDMSITSLGSKNDFHTFCDNVTKSGDMQNILFLAKSKQKKKTIKQLKKTFSTKGLKHLATKRFDDVKKSGLCLTCE